MPNKQFSNWSYFNPVQIRTGVNSLNFISEFILPGKTLLITSQGCTKRGLTKKIASLLYKQDLVIYDEVKPNPQLDDIDSAATELQTSVYNSIIAIGGGSVLDFGKALSILLYPDHKITLDRIFRKNEPVQWIDKIPLIAIPTTSGTGSEVTPFATVWDSLTSKKFSLSNQLVYPTYALLDPSLIIDLPQEITLHTALDCISHALESLWNKNATPITRALAFAALSHTLASFPSVLDHPENINMRSGMQTAAVLAGLCISQTRTALAHSISYPLTLKLGVPHGLACGFTLGELITIYIDQNQEDKESIPLLQAIQQSLLSLNLPEKILKFASLKDILELTDEMDYQSRAANFAPRFNKELIPWLIKKSIQH